MHDVERVTLEVPPRPEYLHVLRAVVAGVAARLDFSYDGIDDLRIAIDEACAHLLDAAPDATLLSVELLPSEDGLEILVSVDAEASPWPPERLEESLAWQVLSALADETGIVPGDRPAVRFRKRLETAGG